MQATQGTQVLGIICDPCTKCVLPLLLFSCSYREHQHSQFNSSIHKYRFQSYQLLQSRNRVIKHCLNSYYAENLCNSTISSQRLLHKRYRTFRWVTYWTHECTLHLFCMMKITPLNQTYVTKRLHNINDITEHSVMRRIWSWTHTLIAIKTVW
jgi:hypothetical protein